MQRVTLCVDGIFAVHPVMREYYCVTCVNLFVYLSYNPWTSCSLLFIKRQHVYSSEQPLGAAARACFRFLVNNPRKASLPRQLSLSCKSYNIYSTGLIAKACRAGELRLTAGTLDYFWPLLKRKSWLCCRCSLQQVAKCILYIRIRADSSDNLSDAWCLCYRSPLIVTFRQFTRLSK